MSNRHFKDYVLTLEVLNKILKVKEPIIDVQIQNTGKVLLRTWDIKTIQPEGAEPLQVSYEWKDEFPTLTAMRNAYEAHQQYLKKMEPMRRSLGRADYYKEMGAFIYTAQRQSGKTTFLVELANKLDKTILITPTVAMADSIRNNFTVPTSCIFARTKDIDTLNMLYGTYNHHLLVDEYQLLDQKELHNVLSYLWKSVTMIGSIK